MLRMGDTMLLATVCAAKDAVPGTDFMPLQVEYREKYSANGRFPGGFTKREGKASDEEILTCRLVDRALRPLFRTHWLVLLLLQRWRARTFLSRVLSQRCVLHASMVSS